MYAGCNGKQIGVANLMFCEALNNAVDEFIRGDVTQIKIFHDDNFAEIHDNGGGFRDAS